MTVDEARKAGILPSKDGEPARKSKSKVRLPGAAKAAGVGRTRARPGRIARADASSFIEIAFEVEGAPAPKERPRTQLSKKAILTAFVKACGSLAKFAVLLDAIKHHTYTPGATVEYEHRVGMIASAAMRGRALLNVPVEVELLFVLEGDDNLWPTDDSDPDVDNIEKSVLDGCNGVVWTDDRLVCVVIKRKVCGQFPLTRVVVRAAT